MSGTIVTLNAGSSSLKLAGYPVTADAPPAWRGTLAADGDVLAWRLAGGPREATPLREDASLEARLDWLFARLARDVARDDVVAVAHRVVHGGARHAGPVVVDRAMRDAIAALAPLAPLHQPANLAALDRAAAHWPRATMVACFDTAFHRTQPRLAQLYALPRALTEDGFIRYGFHGLSYQSIAARLPAIVGARADGRVIVAHLGSGASLCAMHARRSIACTMGWSPLEGIPMGTRSGDVDPGLVLELVRRHGGDADAVESLLMREAGFLGVSGISADLRELEASASPHAREAMDLFAYRVARAIGSLAAALQGLDVLVFTGGIGEHAAAMRAAIAARCDWLGVTLDAAANARHDESLGTGPVAVLRLVADEERVLADAARALLESP